MAHSLSAKKRVRQTVKRRARNRARKDVLKAQLKKMTSAIATGDAKKAGEELRKTVASLDKIAGKGSLHKNTAARKRSRLTLRVNAMQKAKAGSSAK